MAAAARRRTPVIAFQSSKACAVDQIVGQDLADLTRAAICAVLAAPADLPAPLRPTHQIADQARRAIEAPGVVALLPVLLRPRGLGAGAVDLVHGVDDEA